VAETAGRLAEIYGEDAHEARLAGLLHDWDRDLSDAELLAEASALGIPVSDVDERVPYLLHARTGAIAASRALPGLDAVVVGAIARHTVGAAEMTDIDRIVYLADLLEPGRKHEPLESLRADIGAVSLLELFTRGYVASMHYLVERRKLIHPDTVAVWNALAGNGTS
jgi:predicted HD superfamily hydrolase involved in NAD metabolism